MRRKTKTNPRSLRSVSGLPKTKALTVTNRSHRPERICVEQKPLTGKFSREWTVYTPELVPKQPQSGIVRFKVSTRWCSNTRSPKIWRSIPYIDKVGQIHATTLGLWKCNAPQLFGTICSTVHKRLWSVCRKFKHRNKYKSAIGFLSHYYTLTNDDSFFRRCLAMLQRKDHKNLSNTCYWKKFNLDDNTRFLYDQTVHAVLWFQSREERAPHREMSKRCFLQTPLRDAHARPSMVRRGERIVFDDAMTDWARVYSGPAVKAFSVEIDPHRCVKGFSLFRG